MRLDKSADIDSAGGYCISTLVIDFRHILSLCIDMGSTARFPPQFTDLHAGPNGPGVNSLR